MFSPEFSFGQNFPLKMFADQFQASQMGQVTAYLMIILIFHVNEMFILLTAKKLPKKK